MKTAVEWLIEQIEEKNNGVSNGPTYTSIFKQAKEMEKNLYICSKCKSQINGKEIM